MYWSGVPGLKYDRIVFQGLKVDFLVQHTHDLCHVPLSDEAYRKTSYAASQPLGARLKDKGISDIRYHPAREPGAEC